MGVCVLIIRTMDLILIFNLRYEPGIPRLIGTFHFNRKRNVVELEIKQDTTVKGSKKFLVKTFSWRKRFA